MISAFSWQNSISLCPASVCTPRPNLLVTPGVSWLPTFAFQSPIMKRTSFWVLAPEGLVGLHGTDRVLLLPRYWSGHRLGPCCFFVGPALSSSSRKKSISLDQTSVLVWASVKRVEDYAHKYLLCLLVLQFHETWEIRQQQAKNLAISVSLGCLLSFSTYFIPLEKQWAWELL